MNMGQSWRIFSFYVHEQIELKGSFNFVVSEEFWFEKV